jgi:hypothetical protein
MCFLEIHALTKLTEVSLFSRRVNVILKVLTNEKRGGVTVVSFDRSPFKEVLRREIQGLKVLPVYRY